MRKLLFFAVFALITLSAFTQTQSNGQPQPDKPTEVKISGFIMNNLFFDDRKNVDALDGQALLFPLPKALNSVGDDLNKVPNLSLLSFASRLKFGITGPDAFGAKSAGYMEFDFTARATNGTATCASARFRQAWVKLNWEKTELLVGRTWHPLASTDVIPLVMGMSIGAPFQPFNRSDQITLTQKVGKINLILSALYQNDYPNNGPSGKSFAYQNNAILPNLHAQVKYKSDNVIAGVGVDYKRLKPRTFVVSPVDGQKTTTNAGLNCTSLLAYGQVKSGKLTVSAKSLLAANVSESLMTGAYGIVSYNALTGYEEYKPFKHFFIWGNINYGGKLKANLFTGYLKNLGASENILAPTAVGNAPTVFGLGETIGEMIRVTPTVSYTSGKVVVALEVEHNIVDYGTIDYANKGNIKGISKVNGTRVLATMMYNF
jgi:hypothetical protein